METKIKKTLKQWFSNVFPEESLLENLSDYEILHQFAHYTLEFIQQSNMEIDKEPFKIINLLYQNGNLHDRNAIENEFLSVIARNESANSLKMHMDLMPKELRPIYLKTILEN